MRVQVEPRMLAWARERAGIFDAGFLRHAFPKLDAWEAGFAQPTLKQLERFARTVHVPVGYLFLPSPPDERLPIPDFRTIGSVGLRRPSPDLLDVLYACQERQAWYREYAQTTRQPALAFVGSASLDSRPELVAAEMRRVLAFNVAERAACRTWEDALRQFIRQADRVGILVMASGVVQSNTRRKLNPDEFRGFALADPQAPLVFVNGSDTRAAQMFTLAHELAHVWLGASALSNATAVPVGRARPEEAWCNAVAAEFLVPLTELREPVVADCVRPRPLRYISARFKSALLTSTMEGSTLYRATCRMLGVRSSAKLGGMFAADVAGRCLFKPCEVASGSPLPK